MPNDKIDHPTRGSKDLSDATCGAIFNAIEYTPREAGEIVVKTIDSLRTEVKTEPTNVPREKPKGNIGTIPPDLAAFLEQMHVIGS